MDVYDSANEAVYRRSLHLESVTPECYDAYDTQEPLVVTETRRLVISLLGRTTGNNSQGLLQSHQHFAVTVTFEG